MVRGAGAAVSPRSSLGAAEDTHLPPTYSPFPRAGPMPRGEWGREDVF